MTQPVTTVERNDDGTIALAEPLLDGRQLGFEADGRILWRNLDVQLAPGERLAVAGPTGTGKTLLLRTLAGLEPLTAGDIRYRGRGLASWFMPAYRSRVVYVPQTPRLREGTVREALEAPFGFRAHRRQPFPLDAARRHLQSLGRSEAFLEQRAEQLSGGESQIVALLRALLIEPEILLLDEPTASLDDTAARRVEALVDEWLGGDRQRACIWTSHDARQLERVCDRTLNLEPAMP